MIKMTNAQKLFLKLVKASVFSEESVDFSLFSGFNDWPELYMLCRAHSMISVVFECVQKNFYQKIPQPLLNAWKNDTVLSCSVQMRRSSAFLNIYYKLCCEDEKPLVLKGEVLRSLYPEPSARSSLDEDLLIKEESYSSIISALSKLGFEEINSGAQDKHWINKKNSVYLEIHFSPFPSDEKRYALWTKILCDSHESAIVSENSGHKIYSLSRSDNILFLFLHAAKHFAYSGLGIKQLTDMALFMKAFKDDIDFKKLEERLSDAGVLKFARGLCAVIKEYLYADVPLLGGGKEVNNELLEDILESGSLGGSSPQRHYSAHITSAGFKNQSKSYTLKKILFPDKTRLSSRYPFIKKYPFLLPLAWIMRIFAYIKSGIKLEPLKKGNKRVSLLKEYEFIT